LRGRFFRESEVTLAEEIQWACLMEATAQKPGNVHPGASFVDLCYADFVQAASCIAEPLAAVRRVGLGASIYQAVRATKQLTGTNVNLGIILLLAPLAAVSPGIPLQSGVSEVLSRTTIEDAEWVYAAIGLAQPGGMSKVSSQDIRERPTVTLREAMAMAADRDRIAEQYLNNYQLVFEANQKLSQYLNIEPDWEAAIVRLHVWMLSRWPDTLIARKCGQKVAELATEQARQLIDEAEVDQHLNPKRLDEFDRWLRADGHRRNPGTTADLIAATLFVALREGLIQRLPANIPISDLIR
jgi:triphosphoribosyl-dephospho-CoA synthase